MTENSSNRTDIPTPSLLDLFKKYTNPSEEHENTTSVNRKQSNSQTRTSTSIDLNIDYKAKWEESEMKCRLLEQKYLKLENETIKQLQDKINKLQRDYNQIKLIKERVAEICSCKNLTNAQLEQLKKLVNNNNVCSEKIATNHDFLQQTKTLRDILSTNNNQLLAKIENLIKNKRKREQYEDDLIDNDNNH